MPGLPAFQPPEEGLCDGGVLPCALQRLDDLALVDDVLLVAMDQAFAFLEKLLESGAVHCGSLPLLHYRIVPKATLARYAVRLNAAQSTRVARLADIWALARKVWGSDAETRDFLFRPHQLLEGRRPIDVAIENELGGQLVRDLLGRLQYGSAA